MKSKKSIPDDILSQLKAKLQGNHEFRSYYDICDWLKKEFNLDIPYHTVYGIIHTQLRIKPEFKKGLRQPEEPAKNSPESTLQKEKKRKRRTLAGNP